MKRVERGNPERQVGTLRARRFVVNGRVQGVGFRAYVVRKAEQVGVRGEVWNRWDGAVEVVAEHEDESRLERLEDELRNGPGHVRSVRTDVCEVRGFAGFSVGPTR